jgi:ketosteroid isomerase-like protein
MAVKKGGTVMGKGEATRSLALKLVSAFENYDSSLMRECYAPDMRMWHNAFQVEMSGAEHIKLMERTYFHRYLNPKYIDIRIEPFEGGFVQQHVLTAHFADGTRVAMPICVVGRVRDGRITRIDEYLTMGPGKLSEVPGFLPQRD